MNNNNRTALLGLSVVCITGSTVLTRANVASVGFLSGLLVGVGIVGCILGIALVAKNRDKSKA